MICVKIIPRLVVAQEGTNTLIFYVFEYDAEYGTEYSAESGAKQYFVWNHQKTIGITIGKAIGQKRL